LFRPLPGGRAPAHDFPMPGRIGKSYPRAQREQPAQAAPARRGLRFGVIGALIAVLSALGVAGWLIFR
jgi:hypothetical protein